MTTVLGGEGPLTIDDLAPEPAWSLEALSPATRRVYDAIRDVVTYQERDEVGYPRLGAVRDLVASGALRA